MALPVLLALAISQQVDFYRPNREYEILKRAVADPRSIWYSHKSLPPVYESSGRIYHVGYNLSGNLDRTGTINNEHPWLTAAGFDNVGPKVTLKRLLWIPPGRKITLRTVSGVSNRGSTFTRVAGSYPEGTIAAEFAFDGIRLFLTRSRRKVGGDWVTDERITGKTPKGFVRVNNCIECHDDIGKHSWHFDVVRDWYATARGLEVGGPIHWHPWVWPDRSNGSAGMVVREEIAHLIEDLR